MPQNAQKIVKGLTNAQVELMLYEWDLRARDSQLPPAGDWLNWLILAGRGWGKTRTGAEMIKKWVYAEKYPIIHIVGATASDVRDVMVQGDSGIMNVFAPSHRPYYQSSKRCVNFHNGVKALLFSAEEPDRLRGPQCHKAWCDELAAWKYPEAWDQLCFGLRLGDHPQCIITTTPRPTQIIRDLIKDRDTVITKGNTFENKGNLSDSFIKKITQKYEGTTLGRQELYAEVLEDIEGALWKMNLIERNRVNQHPEFKRIVVALDPSQTSKQDSDEAGIVVAGIDYNDICYVLEDCSDILSPDGWARKCIELYDKWNADNIVYESNAGGDMVRTIIQSIRTNLYPKGVHATRGKQTRAEPVAALYEQDKVKHCGIFAKLESEMTTWVPGTGMRSPNRIDAMVWAITELAVKGNNTIKVTSSKRNIRRR